jgi:hypothetical protein
MAAVEGREEAWPVVDLVPGGHGLHALRPEPEQAVDLGMGIAGFGLLLDLPHLGSFAWASAIHSWIRTPGSDRYAWKLRQRSRRGW